MKQLLSILLLFAVSATGPVYAQKNGAKKAKPAKESVPTTLDWHTNLMEANELSKSTHKPIFGFFTGSDWCGWCKKLQNEVFEKASFKKWAHDSVILLELDFPRMKQLPPDLAEQNRSLQQAFQVAGFPTVWIFTMTKIDSINKFNIMPLGSLGYPAGATPGKEDVKFLENANGVLGKKQG